ncbi:nucleotidyltransferase [candidate division WOR-3 bacterium]|nr:nucleotidyltransferase [candidate division WOR-3 bacterium]
MKIDKEFIEICRSLNKHGVKYVVCGGYAIKLHGVEDIAKQKRRTIDYDFIIESSEKNIEKVRIAMKDINPIVKDLRSNDLKKYSTVLIASSDDKYFDIDLISKIWEVDYKKASRDMIKKEIDGVKIPVVSLNHLLEMKKDSFRSRDITDTFWLKKIKEKSKGQKV